MQVLPFYKHTANIGFNHPALYNLRTGNTFQIMCRSNELLPFMCPLPDAWDGTLSVVVRSFPTGQQVYKLGRNAFNHRILKNATGRYVVYAGGDFGCMDLDVCGLYYLQINNYVSEVFSVFVDRYGLLKFTLSSSQNVAGLPYSSAFNQYFYTKGFIQPPDYEPFSNASTDEAGNKSITYARLTKSYTFSFDAVRPSIQGVFASLTLVENLEIADIFGSITVDARQAKVSFENKKSWWSDVTVTLPELAYYDTNACSTTVFVEDSAFPGTSNAEVCADPSALELPQIHCENPLTGIDAGCDEETAELDFIVQLQR